MTTVDVAATVAASPTESRRILVSGGLGSGKTTALAAVRDVLHSAGIPVLARPPRAGDPSGAAIVVDDAHLLGGADLSKLTATVSDSSATVIVAAEPLTGVPELTELTTALAREAPAVRLGPLGATEIASAATAILGSAPPAEMVRSVATATAGLPFLVHAAVAAAASPDGESPGAAISSATRTALVDRLRRIDQPVLDALLISSLSPELGPDDVAGALHLDAAVARDLVDRARATGLIAPSLTPTFLRTLHRCLAQVCGAIRHHDIEVNLLRVQIDNATLTTDLGLRLAEHGLRDPLLADALTDLAERHRDHPVRAVRLYRAATEVGGTARSTRLADALAATGDCATARGLTDDLLGSEDPAERAAAVRIAGSVAAHDGATAEAAELFGWLGTHPDPLVSSAGVVVAVGAGDVAVARTLAGSEGTGPPTSTARAARRLSDGLLATLDQPYATAMATMSQSVTEGRTWSGVAPDTSAALVALTAMHGGDPGRARSVLTRALAVPGDDAAFTAHRHRLLLGWLRMQDGQLAAASADVAAADLHRRDHLWAAALQTAIARRSGDGGAVQKHWYAAMDVLDEYSVDLYCLLPLGELWVAAARIQQVERIGPAVTRAFELLGALGDPPLWSVPLRWAGVHAGILANSPDAVAPHGAALTAAAAGSAFARSLALAGRTWLRVLASQVDVDEVTVAARGLARFGLTWDATRLASQAALQTPDGRTSAAMLQLARDLKVSVSPQEAADRPSTPIAAGSQSGGAASSMPNWSRLSDREREVAELVLQGMPYRDIGSQLLISAKTVEHHVARIRRRLGAESRSELISMLRAILGSPAP
ncbi:isoniazid response ATPase/transcriptional regulator IniR [Mycolicibacterium sediminis]|uniref:LuxR family transcriptional regulator n=1 Tax=Mycolicibacterium sediminis TaxID=1286180 RepID=A0A7I7QNX0_9MYCO|nr:isoniazid response ATPase/transcriptional regulator IniR [Mycolicibacterium sediminis]BBY27697.1 LuxR family transcriptional regulator [Mycolicibacterium sediminis]